MCYKAERRELYQKLDMSLEDRKSTRLNSSHLVISYAVFCLKKNIVSIQTRRRRHIPMHFVENRYQMELHGDNCDIAPPDMGVLDEGVRQAPLPSQTSNMLQD